ncbi:hypothetical protein C5167_044171 [Papaver somniferum]|uniref:Uncharacterized protein n=1 Tax=Papaver somniferum TaxID=3469 RepID=A0A4Y7LAQ9_PAPSO|nr:hypothetical protein C5167_044171 [Papaver somniferum]
MKNQRRWSNKLEIMEDLKSEEGDRYKSDRSEEWFSSKLHKKGARTKCQVDGESFFEKAEVPKRIRNKYAASTSTAATKKTATSTLTAAGTKKKKAARISIGNIKVKQNFTAGSEQSLHRFKIQSWIVLVTIIHLMPVSTWVTKGNSMLDDAGMASIW